MERRGCARILFMQPDRSREADEHEERAPGGCRGTPKKHNGLFGQSVGELGGKAIEAKDVEHPRKVVAERHQAPLAAHLVEATHEEVAVAGPTFERAERMFDQAGAAAHQRGCILHPRPMTLDDVLVLPAVDSARRCLVGDAAPAQGARITGGFSAHITDLEPAAGVFLQATRRP